MRLQPSHIVVPLTLLVLALVLVTAHTRAEIPCVRSQTQLDNGLVAQAAKGFAAIRDDDPGSTCAKRGAEDVVRQECDDAQTALDNDLLVQAGKAFHAILAEQPANACASRGMVKAVVKLCARAKQLKDRKATTAATKAYGAILALEPLKTIDPCPVEGLVDPAGQSSGGNQVVVIRGANGRNGRNGKNGRNGRNGANGRNAEHRRWTG